MMAIVDKLYEKDPDNNFTSNALFYQDILRFFMKEKSIRPFKFTDLANWLLDNNVAMRNEFISSNVPKSYRVHSKSSFIKSRLNEFIAGHRIDKVGTTKSEKNNSETPLYQFNIFGFHLVRSVFKNINPKEYEDLILKHIDPFYDLAKESLNNDYSIEYQFYLLLLDKFYNNQIDYDDFIDFASVFIVGSYRIHIFTLFFPWLDEGNGDGFRRFALDKQVFSKPKIKSLIMDILNSLDQETRSLLLFQIKLGVEDYYFMRYTNREFELQRFLHRTNYEEIVIQTKCKICNSYFPQILSISNFLQQHMGLMDESQKFDCPKCNQNNKPKTCKLVTVMY